MSAPATEAKSSGPPLFVFDKKTRRIVTDPFAAQSNPPSVDE